MIITYTFDEYEEFNFTVDLKEEKKIIASHYADNHSMPFGEAYQWLDENDMFDDYEEENYDELYDNCYYEFYDKAYDEYREKEEDYKDYQSFLKSLPR